MQLLTHIKETLGPIWDLLLLVIGWFFKKIYDVTNNYLRRRKIKNKVNRSSEIEDLNIKTLSSATPYFDKNNTQTILSDKCFYIKFPEELLSNVLEHDEGFEVYENTSFNGHSHFEDIIRKTEIDNLEELINKHKYKVADFFVNQTEGCKFNRSKLGIYRFNSRKSPGIDETPLVKIELFKTDYFTHRVMRSIYQELKELRHPIADVNSLQQLEKYNAFTTSLGINAYLIAETKIGESIIFSRRAQTAAYSENHFKYNSTVMEGVSLTDWDSYENAVSLHTALKKGLLEELGITRDTLLKYDFTLQFCDFFLEKNYFEVGVTATVRLHDLYEEIVRDLPGKDKEFEIDRLTPIRYTKKDIEKFVNNHSFYHQGLYTLKMVCAREMIFINLPKIKSNKQ